MKFLTIKNRFAVENIFKQPLYVQAYFCSGVSKWNEEFNAPIKHEIEKHWKDKIFNSSFNINDSSKEKIYILSMFPYPSGKLHMGHVRVYTISDAVARYHRMNGKNVLHPIGWDAFGLPAENAALANNIDADTWTKANIHQMKNQLKRLGCSFDWSREISTCNPNYYKWTQHLFIKIFKAGLAYQKKAYVNWDPIDKTVLAHEQVDENGNSWRSGAKVEKKLLKQWFIRTTRFAKDLLDGLNDPVLKDWRDIIKLQQHWIGDCNGVSFDFKLSEDADELITVWTSKPELLTQAKFIAVKSKNQFTKVNRTSVNGVFEAMCKAVNPLTGESIPIFITDTIEYEPFTDTHLGIPAGFENDRIFAKSLGLDYNESKELSEHETNKLQNDVCDKALKLGVGGYWTSAKLQDWLISRQRYWGTPIPIIHCDSCGAVPVPEKDLPVTLPISSHNNTHVVDETWIRTECPNCGKPARRECDTMDTFVDSAWYYLRYIDPHNETEPFSKELAKKLTPVDLYIGGKEHAVLHLYYARFFNHFLHSLGLVPEREPFKRLLVQGMIMGQSYRIKGTGKYVAQSQVTIIDAKKKKAIVKESGEQVVMSWEKMSKSKLNGVDPEGMFDEYGVDTTRLLVLADVAPTSHRNWNVSTFPGILNWQRRLWLTISDFIKYRQNHPEKIANEEFEKHEHHLWDSRNFYVKGVTFNYYTSQQMSVAVSKMQGLTNSLRRVPPSVMALGSEFERALAAQIIVLAPMAPHFASELWSGLQSAPNRINVDPKDFNWNESALNQKWPEVDIDFKLDLVCQTNGIENAIIKIPRLELENLDFNTAKQMALQRPEVQKVLVSREILDVKLDIFKGYEAVVNILTSGKKSS